MAEQHSDPNESPLKFPCKFPIKVMGRNADDFATLVADIVRRHVPASDVLDIATRESRENRFLSVSVTITAPSRQQLDALYSELTACEHVLMAL